MNINNFILEKKMDTNFAIFSSPASIKFAEGICRHLGLELGKLKFKTFADGELWCQFEENIRGKHVFLICSTMAPSGNWFQLWMMIDAAKRASAEKITAVIPYYGNARQERKDRPRVPITAKMVANITEHLGAHRIVTMDLHSGSIQGFCEIPFDHLYGSEILLKAMFAEPTFLGINVKKIVGVAPDEGSINSVSTICDRHGWSLAVVPKKRKKPNLVEEINLPVLGDVKDKICIIIDDIGDTFGTIQLASEKLVKAGALMVFAAVTHPLLSSPALDRLTNSKIEKLWVSDTVPLSLMAENHPKIIQVSVTEIFSQAIKKIYQNKSVTELFP